MRTLLKWLFATPEFKAAVKATIDNAAYFDQNFGEI